jgi:GNAT superfamily N-acetyltransferase
VQLPRSPIPGLRTIELGPGHEALLQRFFDANPEYFVTVQGEPASPNEAHDEIHGDPPAGWHFTRRWLVGYVGPDGSLAAIAHVVSDFLAQGVWHLGLFIVAAVHRGTGDAQALNQGLERWAKANGAKWLRLGVVEGNARAERFWASRGYVQVRTREGVQVGRQTRTVRVMAKPLAGGSIEEFLALVPRDRPDAPDAR